MKRIIFLISLSLIVICTAFSQEKALVNTVKSPFAKLRSVDMTDITWTDGFWAERFAICKESMVPHMLGMYMDAEISHGYRNFEIAAGLKEGEHVGPPFHDGDFYKMVEALISIYGVTQDKETEKQIDDIIATIAATQREDGYIHTPVMIERLKHPDKKAEFNERLDFETYNMGHLMTTACIHYRLTGKKNFLDIAIKSTDFLYNFYKTATAELARNAICPSHYMGVTEMYRTTRDPRYLELAKSLVEIRSMVENGTDHNQDRIPFKQQTEAIGHAVRANYLYAGVADVYAETGDDSLMIALDKIWHNLVEQKMYINGSCGALYDGVSPNGTTYDQPSIQQVHQAYGANYELPNRSAHNESCANIGNILWNWRMLQITGEARFAEVMENTMYNSLLGGVSLDGTGYFYTNPLSVNEASPDTLRWSKEREKYISYCNCCPPNTIRTIAQIQNYVYSISNDGVYINLYGASQLSTKLNDGSSFAMQQTTNYPWEGDVTFTIKKSTKKEIPLYFRVPEWCNDATLKINNRTINVDLKPGTYTRIARTWKKDDMIQLDLNMKTVLIESNPLVEATRNQVAVKRGPIIYCIESADISDNSSVFDYTIPNDVEFVPEMIQIGSSQIMSLKGTAIIKENNSWNNALYRPINQQLNTKEIRLIPYYAWGNRAKGDMTVWIPVK